VSTKTAAVNYDGTGLRFTARSGSGHQIVLDNAEGNAGPRPAELVPMALGSCTAMDVISILQKKRQVVTRYEVSVEAEQREGQPAIFTRAVVVHLVEGPAIDEAAVRRAIELSAAKYCSVGATLASGPVEIRHRYRIVVPGAPPIEAEAVVEGPNADPDAAARSVTAAG
jgi:putative redox protein